MKKLIILSVIFNVAKICSSDSGNLQEKVPPRALAISERAPALHDLDICSSPECLSELNSQLDDLKVRAQQEGLLNPIENQSSCEELLNAVKANDLLKVLQCLDSGFDPNCKETIPYDSPSYDRTIHFSSQQMTPLRAALELQVFDQKAEIQRRQIIIALLNSGANPFLDIIEGGSNEISNLFLLDNVLNDSSLFIFLVNAGKMFTLPQLKEAFKKKSDWYILDHKDHFHLKHIGGLFDLGQYLIIGLDPHHAFVDIGFNVCSNTNYSLHHYPLVQAILNYVKILSSHTDFRSRKMVTQLFKIAKILIAEMGINIDYKMNDGSQKMNSIFNGINDADFLDFILNSEPFKSNKRLTLKYLTAGPEGNTTAEGFIQHGADLKMLKVLFKNRLFPAPILARLVWNHIPIDMMALFLQQANIEQSFINKVLLDVEFQLIRNILRDPMVTSYYRDVMNLLVQNGANPDVLKDDSNFKKELQAVRDQKREGDRFMANSFAHAAKARGNRMLDELRRKISFMI